MTENERKAGSIDGCFGIGKDEMTGIRELSKLIGEDPIAALYLTDNLQLPDGRKKDALYAGIVLYLAGMADKYNPKEIGKECPKDSAYQHLQQQLLNYCTDQCSYFQK